MVLARKATPLCRGFRKRKSSERSQAQKMTGGSPFMRSLAMRTLRACGAKLRRAKLAMEREYPQSAIAPQSTPAQATRSAMLFDNFKVTSAGHLERQLFWIDSKPLILRRRFALRICTHTLFPAAHGVNTFHSPSFRTDVRTSASSRVLCAMNLSSPALGLAAYLT